MFALAQATHHNDQQQCEKNLQEIHIKNKEVCEELRDALYESSHTKRLTLWQLSKRENTKRILTQFDENGCYNNSFLPTIDRDLIKKLDTDLKK